MRTVSKTPSLIGRAAMLAACIALVSAASAEAAAIGTFTTRGAWSFVSAPQLHPPKLEQLKSSNRLAPGLFMVANFPNLAVTQPAHGKAQPLVGQSGPLVLDKHLQPIWFRPVPTNVVAGNLREQTENGRPVLTWWQGVVTNTGVTTSGEDVVIDQHYRTVATLTGKNGWVISEHEMVISGHDAWVTAYRQVPMNLTAYRGLTGGVLLDAAVQEYNLINGNLLGTWDALHHIPLTQSEQPAPRALVGGKAPPWDAYHINSIQLVGAGKFLVSLRNTWAAYLVDIDAANLDSSSTEWALGGKTFPGVSTFTFGRNASFEWQHDVELHSGSLVSIFDDACCRLVGKTFQRPSGPTRGLVLRIDQATHTASFVAQYARGRSFNSAFLGNTDLLPNGNVVVGWGSQPYFSEFSKSGKMLLDALWPGPDQSYRAVVARWTGTPGYGPAGAVLKQRTATTIYASWNGATGVAGWRVLAGSTAGHLRVIVRRAGDTGFETAISLGRRSYKMYKVQALDSRGHLLGASNAFPRSRQGSGLPQSY